MRWVPYVAIALMVPTLFGVLPGGVLPDDPPVRSVGTAGRAVTVVLSAPDDPYRRLAGEIAARERARLADDWESALSGDVDFLLWVAAPGRLSDATMVRAGKRLQEARPPPAVGIITGTTATSAGSLYRRGARASGRRALVVRGEYPAASIEEPGLRWVDDPADPGAGEKRESHGHRWQPTSLDSVTDAMMEADYVAFNGHGTAVSWRLDPGPQGALRADDVPRLWNTMATAAACQTLRPWVPGSIALAFVDQGAAGYAGFTYSPVAGYGLGSRDEMPLRHTWPGFTVGQVVRLQNLAAGKGFAAFPQYWLLGDPRTVLRGDRPYRRERLAHSDERIRMRLSGVPSGWLPLRVPGGAGYSEVRVRHAAGEVVAWQGDPLFDARIQIADRRRAKLVLVRTPGGEVAVELRRRSIPARALLDIVVGSLDHTLIHLPRGGGDLIALLAGLAALAGAALAARRRGSGIGPVGLGLVVGIGFGGFHALWSLARVDVVSIISKPLGTSPVASVATGLLAATGAWLFITAGSRRGRLLAVLVAVFPAWATAAFALSVWAGSEVLFRTRMDDSPYAAVMALPPAIATVLWVAAFLLVVAGLARLVSTGAGAGAPSEA